MPNEEVKWIKIKVGMFDGESFKRIKRAKIGGEKFRDKLTAVWFELLDLSGKCNNNGFLMHDEIAYKSYEDIAIMLDREEEEIELCMQYYLANNMIEIINDCYCLSNWCKYQNVDGLEKIREQTRIRVARHRENKKLLCNDTCNNNVTLPSQDNNISNSYSNSISNSNSLSNNINNNSSSNKSNKQKYGEFNNVALTDDELEKLKEKFPYDWEKKIENLSSYLAQFNKKYKSHYATILNWSRKDSNVQSVQNVHNAQNEQQETQQKETSEVTEEERNAWLESLWK